MIWIPTSSGRRFCLSEPCAADIEPEDIAHALAMICRWGGHVRDFYSVAEHSVLVATAVENRWPKRLDLHLWALLHDAAEAYVGDVTAPLGRLLPDHAAVERAVFAAVAERFCLPPVLPAEVRVVDAAILIDEAQALLPAHDADALLPVGLPIGCEIECWSPKCARTTWLAFFERLHTGYSEAGR
ncbi:hypothetical protein EDC65_2268 [Stella humosa]|uniref:Phosphohydrolase n=1 Tax=Stella humosa TaxID=94 RepID=A0A3N1MB37_9PROT|nr:phosphohydrolase [Stella humosa]ROQ00469.1 hypothetical protein EDC65_2268 [Stella humosa]BBK30286.1 hypothetical protein STHU_09200 [Stella humosa]